MPTVFLKGHRSALIALALTIFAGTAYGMWRYLTPAVPLYDAVLVRTFDGISDVFTYTQNVETEVELSDRRIRVKGMYFLNGPENRFASYATTTLMVQEGRKRVNHVFTLQNISIGNDVFVKIETEDEILRTSIPHSPEWRHFTKDSIPAAFTNIAVAGPILDNLLLFKDGGAYLTLTQSHGTALWDKDSYLRYSFTLSDLAPKEAGGTLAALLGRIGDSGIIDLWIDEETAQVRHMVVTSENYHSTTTISDINNTPAIDAPIL